MARATTASPDESTPAGLARSARGALGALGEVVGALVSPTGLAGAAVEAGLCNEDANLSVAHDCAFCRSWRAMTIRCTSLVPS